MGNIVFSCTDIYLRQVTLESARLNNHIVEESGHIEMKNDPLSIQRTVTDPTCLYESSYNPRRDVYFGKGKHRDYPDDYVKVVVDFENPNHGYVVSAWTTDVVGTSIGRLKYEKKSST